MLGKSFENSKESTSATREKSGSNFKPLCRTFRAEVILTRSFTVEKSRGDRATHTIEKTFGRKGEYSVFFPVSWPISEPFSKKLEVHSFSNVMTAKQHNSFSNIDLLFLQLCLEIIQCSSLKFLLTVLRCLLKYCAHVKLKRNLKISKLHSNGTLENNEIHQLKSRFLKTQSW